MIMEWYVELLNTNISFLNLKQFDIKNIENSSTYIYIYKYIHMYVPEISNESFFRYS